MNKTNLTMIVVLGLLIVLSAVQAIQLGAVKNVVADGQVVSSGTSGNTPVKSTSSTTKKSTKSLPSSIKDLPAMVGGC